MRNNLLPIAKEGWKYIGCSVVFIFVFSFLDFDILKFLSYVLLASFLFIFRNPERESIIYEQNSVVSPVDGKVISIQEIKDEEFAYKLTIDSSCVDVTLLRVPVNSTLVSSNFYNGARLSRFSPLADAINEKIDLVFEDNNKNILKIQHRLKQTFAPINVNIIKKQKLQQGFRYGLMVNGVTTIYLAQNFRLNVSVGNEVKASQTLIGYFS